MDHLPQDGVTILQNGNVGIAVENPLYRLHITENESAWQFLHSANGNPQIGIKDSSGAYSALTLYNTIDDEPTMEFGFPVAQGTARNFNFRTAGVDRMTIRGTGFVGINTTSPSSRLHVSSGDVQVTEGDIYLENINRGVIMKSPQTGNAGE